MNFCFEFKSVRHRTKQNMLEILLNIELVLSNLQSVHMFWLAWLDLIPCGMDFHMSQYSEASVSLRPPNRKVLPLPLPSLPFPTPPLLIISHP